MALAQGYVSGVADATQGRLWCDKTEVKTHEIDSMVFSDLKDLPEKSLSQSASGEIIKSLARRFPCHIDIVSAPSGGLARCGSNCYWNSSEVWF